jgi:hypothetical protein
MRKETLKISRRGKDALTSMRRAVRRAIAENHALGIPVYIWRDGKVVTLPPPARKKSR